MSARHPLLELRALLRPLRPTRGVVTARTGNQLTVATRAGLATAIAADAAIAVGQEVSIRDGVAYRRARISGAYAL